MSDDNTSVSFNVDDNNSVQSYTYSTSEGYTFSGSIFNYNLEFIKTHPDAILPKKNHDSDTGYDVFSVEEAFIPAKGSSVVDVGLKLANVPYGYWFKVETRSGLGFKKNILCHPGIIDNSYKGMLGIKLYNLGDIPVKIDKGVAIAQFVLYPIVSTSVKFTDKATESDRGEKGFGSSGM